MKLVGRRDFAFVIVPSPWVLSRSCQIGEEASEEESDRGSPVIIKEVVTRVKDAKGIVDRDVGSGMSGTLGHRVVCSISFISVVAGDRVLKA